MHCLWRALIAAIIGILFEFAAITVFGRRYTGWWLPLYHGAQYRNLPFGCLWLIITLCHLSMTLVALATFGILTRYLRPPTPFEKETRCRKCGYILRGITEPRCPECGERI